MQLYGQDDCLAHRRGSAYRIDPVGELEEIQESLGDHRVVVDDEHSHTSTGTFSDPLVHSPPLPRTDTAGVWKGVRPSRAQTNEATCDYKPISGTESLRRQAKVTSTGASSP